MRRQIRAGRRRGGVSVHAHTCSCPGDFSEPPATSFWFRTSGSSIGVAPASRLSRGAASGEMCSPRASPCPPPSLHIPSGLYHPLWSSVTLATLGDFRSELTRLLPGSHPAEPGWGEDWRGRQWPLGVQAKLTRGGWAGKATGRSQL